MGVCYDDSQFTWYAKDPKAAAAGAPKANKTSTEATVAGKKRPRQHASADHGSQTKAAGKAKVGDGGGGGGGKGDRSKGDLAPPDLSGARHSDDHADDAADADAGGKKKRLRGPPVAAPAEPAKAASKAEGAATAASSKAAKAEERTAEGARKATKDAPKKTAEGTKKSTRDAPKKGKTPKGA
jgi:hypothetical protein